MEEPGSRLHGSCNHTVRVLVNEGGQRVRLGVSG